MVEWRDMQNKKTLIYNLVTQCGLTCKRGDELIKIFAL